MPSSTRQEIPVILEEAIGPIAKTVNGYGRAGFSAPIAWTLVDGRRIESTFFRERKKDVAAHLATLPCQPENPTKATFHDGKFSGTSSSYFIGPRDWPVCPHCLGAYDPDSTDPTGHAAGVCEWRRAEVQA